MNITEHFLTASESIWAQYHTHPFVKGIGDGTLDKAKFKRYIIQDYLYLIDYAKVFSIGSAKARTLDAMQFFSGYANQLFAYETDIHKGYMQRFEITQSEINDAKMTQDNLSYVSYMLRAAYEGGAAEALAAIMPCAVSYEVIARKIVRNNPASANHPFYGEWITGYASDAYHEGNVKITAMMNRLADGLSGEQLGRLTEIFSACSRYELAFWNMAWNMTD